MGIDIGGASKQATPSGGPTELSGTFVAGRQSPYGGCRTRFVWAAHPVFPRAWAASSHFPHPTPPHPTPAAVAYAPNSAFTVGGGNSGPAAVAAKAGKRPLRWAIFTPPKPFSKAPHQLAALRSWLNLRVPPQVFLVEAADLEREELRRLEEEYGVRTVACQTNSEGMLRVRAPACGRACGRWLCLSLP